MDMEQMPGHLIRRYQQAAVAIFHREVTALGYDLTPVQFAALDRVATSPGIDQVTLAGRIAYDRTTITGVIDRLIRKGWLERTVSTRDRRSRVLQLTDEGKNTLAAIRPAVESAQQIMLQGLSKEEADLFLGLLKKATEQVNELSRAPLKASA